MLCLTLLSVFVALAAGDRLPNGTIACDPAARPVVITTSGSAFSSPNNPADYPPNQICEYRFTATAGLIVSLSITDYSLEDCVDCGCDKIEFFNGPDDTGVLLQTICGGGSNIAVAGGQDLFMRFTSDASTEFSGFAGTVAFVNEADTACLGGAILLGPNGTFTSPNYPSTYDDGSVCSWTFQVPDPSYRVRIAFSDFSLEDSCESAFGAIYDFVDFYEQSNNNRLGRWWGNGPNNPEFWFANYEGEGARVEFISDFVVGATGFSANYEFYVPA